MAAVRGIDGAKVFKVDSATPEGQGSTFYPFFVSVIAAGLSGGGRREGEGGTTLSDFCLHTTYASSSIRAVAGGCRAPRERSNYWWRESICGEGRLTAVGETWGPWVLKGWPSRLTAPKEAAAMRPAVVEARSTFTRRRRRRHPFKQARPCDTASVEEPHHLGCDGAGATGCDELDNE
ncbi:hypothetical protein VPH35_104505 [Triticum aestivum]